MQLIPPYKLKTPSFKTISQLNSSIYTYKHTHTKSKMIQSKISQEMNYFTSEYQSTFPSNFNNLIQTNLPRFQFDKFLPNLQNYETAAAFPVLEFNNTTSDEAEFEITDERKKRRMISNRESARRSRMRKQRQLDELWSQVLRLRTENLNLIEKLNHVSESNERIVQENVQLKEEASELGQMLTDFQITNSYIMFRDLEQISCIESSDLESVTSTEYIL